MSTKHVYKYRFSKTPHFNGENGSFLNTLSIFFHFKMAPFYVICLKMGDFSFSHYVFELSMVLYVYKSAL